MKWYDIYPGMYRSQSNDDSDDYGFAETMEVTGPGAFTADDER